MYTCYIQYGEMYLLIQQYVLQNFQIIQEIELFFSRQIIPTNKTFALFLQFDRQGTQRL